MYSVMGGGDKKTNEATFGIVLYPFCFFFSMHVIAGEEEIGRASCRERVYI